jgi:hypothetical protein
LGFLAREQDQPLSFLPLIVMELACGVVSCAAARRGVGGRNSRHGRAVLRRGGRGGGGGDEQAGQNPKCTCSETNERASEGGGAFYICLSVCLSVCLSSSLCVRVIRTRPPVVAGWSVAGRCGVSGLSIFRLHCRSIFLGTETWGKIWETGAPPLALPVSAREGGASGGW